MSDIRFYSARDRYGCFSNFASYPVNIDGRTWPTSEHYFQAQKFKGMPYEHEIRKAPSPMKAARLGRSRKVKIRDDWESVKDDIMYRVVLAKFTQHPEIREILLATGDAQIIEHTSRDSYWGDGGDGSGRNQLGKTLMRVRKVLALNKA